MLLGRITVALAISLVAACSSGKSDVEDDFSELAEVDLKSDYFSYRLRLLGAIGDGEVKRTLYSKTPRFRGFDVTATAGDQLDVWVRSTQGDAVAWVLDGRFRVIAKNDDADDTTYDAHVVVTLPASPVPNRYYVVFRDYDLEQHWYEVSLRHTTAQPPAGWELAAKEEVQRLAGEFAPLAPFAVPVSALPAAARARYDASHAVLEVPLTYKLTVAGRVVWLVLVTDGSGEGNIVVVDLIDGAGRWFAHGIGHTFWDGDAAFNWDLDDTDPTMCSCDGRAPPQMAACTGMDGATSISQNFACE